jgi:hypothetical protein
MNIPFLYPLFTEPLDFKDSERSGKIMMYCSTGNSFILCFKYGKYQKLAKLMIYLRINGKVYPCLCVEKEVKNHIVKTRSIMLDADIMNSKIEIVSVESLVSLQLEKHAVFISFPLKIKAIVTVLKEILWR